MQTYLGLRWVHISEGMYSHVGISDSAYLDNDTYRVLIPTAWIPLVDANEANGCMEVKGYPI